MQDVLWNIPLHFGQYDLWSQIQKDFKFLLSFFYIGPTFWWDAFFLLFFSDKIKQEKGKSKIGDFILFYFIFCLFLVVSSLTCTLKKSCHFILPKFHLFPFLPFIHTNIPLKHWLLFHCFSLLFFSSDNTAQEKGKSIFFRLFLVLV